MQTGVCLDPGSVCQLNADVLSNSRTRSFRRIRSNDMTYIHPGAPALMHRRRNMDPVTQNTHSAHTHTLACTD